MELTFKDPSIATADAADALVSLGHAHAQVCNCGGGLRTTADMSGCASSQLAAPAPLPSSRSIPPGALSMTVTLPAPESDDEDVESCDGDGSKGGTGFVVATGTKVTKLNHTMAPLSRIEYHGSAHITEADGVAVVKLVARGMWAGGRQRVGGTSAAKSTRANRFAASRLQKYAQTVKVRFLDEGDVLIDEVQLSVTPGGEGSLVRAGRTGVAVLGRAKTALQLKDCVLGAVEFDFL